MIGNAEVLKTLQAAIAAEAQLNLQYRLDWRTVKFLGAKKVAKYLKGFGHDSHKWLRQATDHLLFLGGAPAYSVSNVAEQKTLTATLQNELDLEMATVRPYEEFIQTAQKALDDDTRNKFEHWIKWHHGHIGWLEQQLRLIAAIGENDYVGEKL